MVQQEIKAAYDILAQLSVSGDAIEVMAKVREHLRRAYKEAGTIGGQDNKQPTASK